jgi:hypothetical protein
MRNLDLRVIYLDRWIETNLNNYAGLEDQKNGVNVVVQFVQHAPERTGKSQARALGDEGETSES